MMKHCILAETSQQLILLRDEFVAFSQEVKNDGVHLGNIELMQTDLQAYLKNEEDQSRGIGLPEGWVPHTRFWYIKDTKRIIGSIDLRHSLTHSLEDLGGHIGYIVRASERNKGYATSMLADTLVQAKKIGLDRVYLTTDVNNIASRRVIEKNGGVLAGETMSVLAKRMTARYWINLF